MKGKTGKLARHGRRALSVFLSVLMLMSAWVFVAPKANAASYNITVSWNVKNTKDTYDGNRMILKNGSNSQSIPSNGVAATKNSGAQSETVTLSWIPETVEYRCQGNIADISEYYMTSITVNGVPIWSGSIGCKKQNITTNTASTTLTISTGSCSSWSNGGSNSSTTTSSHATADTLQPKNTTVNASVSPTSISCSGGSATFSSSVVDQYGESLGSSASMTYSSLPSGASRSGATVTFPQSMLVTSGSVTMTAAFSGLTSKTATVSYTGHTFGTVTYTWSGTTSCTASRKCSVCNYTHSQNATITSSVKTPATCTAKGTTRYTATFSHSAFSTQTKDIQDIAALGHSYTGDYVNQSTGKHYKKCVRFSACGTYGIGTTQNSTENCTADSTWTTDANQHWKTCTKCSGLATAKANHSGGTANCTTLATCATCGVQYGSTNDSHNWQADPTWTWTAQSGGGYTATATYTCSRNSSHTSVQNATVTSSTTNATCTAAGSTVYTASVTFNGATKTATKTDSIAALGHNPQKIAAVDATCTTAGNNEYYKCTRCNKYFTTSACTTETTVAAQTIAALGHDYSGAYRALSGNKHDRLCTKGCGTYGIGSTEGGSEDCTAASAWSKDASGHWKTCAHCTNIVVAKTNHDKSGWVTTDGTKHWKTCTTCSYSPLDEANHTWEWVTDTAASCTTAGVKHEKCSTCGKIRSENTTIPAAGHTLSKNTNAKSATCTETGLIDTWKCSVCNKIFSDD